MNDSKQCSEARRLIAAFGHAFEGLKAVRNHPAFRTEVLTTLVMGPLALLMGKNGVERALLIGSLMLVLVVELLNTGIEATIDRISTEWHSLSKFAKDVGSAAVLVSIINASMIWFFIVLT